VVSPLSQLHILFSEAREIVSANKINFSAFEISGHLVGRKKTHHTFAFAHFILVQRTEH
jgi:hypothetical protein